MMKINQKSKLHYIPLLIFLLSCTSTWSQEVSKLPPLYVNRKPQIDIQHIAINLQFDWKKKQAYGTAKLLFSALKNTSQINLDAGMLTINSIKLSDGTALQFNYDGSAKNDALEILLNKTYKTNEKISLVIDYHTNWINEIDPNTLGGNNGKGLRFTEPTSNDPLKKREIWSFSDVESNRYWFPSYDAPNDLRTTEFTATVTSDLTVVANGTLESKKNNSNGTTTFHYKAKMPYANHLTAFVVGEFLNVKQKFQNKELNNFGYSEQKDWIEATVERLPDMMSFFSNLTGVNYPHTNYSQVFVQDIGTFSGNNTFSTITENMVDDYNTHADYYYLWDLTEAEALAQQWFGSCISPENWSDTWLTKSLAHHCNGLYNEYRNGKDEFLLYQHSYDQSVYFFDWNSGYQRPIVTTRYEDVTTISNDNYTTIRGAIVLHLLRKQVGEKNWKKTIQHFVKNNQNKIVTTQNLIQSVKQISGESMSWFFDQWLYKMGHPIFEVSKKYNPLSKELTLFVKQTQKINTNNAYPQTAFFQGKIFMEIDDRIEEIQLQATEVNTFTFQCKSEPKLVNFDFESSWIKEITFEKTLDELLYQLQYSKDILARNSALTELVVLSKKETITNEDKSRIKTAIESIISGDSYWRLRLSAISQLANFYGKNPLDETSKKILLNSIQKDNSWTKANAIKVLSSTNDWRYVELYIFNLNDSSQRVVAAAATALGKSKSPKAFETLVQLMEKPSMKSQSRIAALIGLRELGDPRGFEIAMRVLSDTQLPRWRLATSNWDYRVFAAQLIANLGKSEETFPFIFERFKNSLNENDIDGIFNNIVLINTLAYSKGQKAYDLVKEKFKYNTTVLSALSTFEEQFKNAIKF